MIKKEKMYKKIIIKVWSRNPIITKQLSICSLFIIRNTTFRRTWRVGTIRWDEKSADKPWRAWRLSGSLIIVWIREWRSSELLKIVRRRGGALLSRTICIVISRRW